MTKLEVRNAFYSYAFYSLAGVIFVSALLMQSGALVLLSVVLLLASALYFRSGHVINNLLLRRGSVIEISDGYTLSEDLSAAVKKIGNEYHAVSCVLLSGDPGERNGEHLETLVAKADFPFEFGLGVRSVEHVRILDALEEKRRLKEIELARTDPKKQDRINGLRRELSTIESEIRSVRGEKLLSLSMCLKTFARSQSGIDAAREASRNAGIMADSFSSMLGFEHEVLKGEALLQELETGLGAA